MKANSNSEAASSFLLAHCGSHQGDRCLVDGPEKWRCKMIVVVKQARGLLKGTAEVMRQIKYQRQTLDSALEVLVWSDLQKRFSKTFSQTAQIMIRRLLL